MSWRASALQNSSCSLVQIDFISPNKHWPVCTTAKIKMSKNPSLLLGDVDREMRLIMLGVAVGEWRCPGGAMAGC
jgi:hypothetical protein